MAMLLKVLYFLSLSTIGLCTWSPRSSESLGVESDQLNIVNYKPTLLKPYFYDNDECFCLPINKNNDKIQVLLNAQDSAVERLVVYLYKVRGVLHLYVPNKQKQILLPELTFDDGDVLKQTWSEPVDQLFSSNPNVINSQLKPHQPGNSKGVDTDTNASQNERNPESSTPNNVDKPIINQDNQNHDHTVINELNYPLDPVGELDVIVNGNENISPENSLIIDLPNNNPFSIDQILTPDKQNSQFYDVDMSSVIKYPSLLPSNLDVEQLRHILLLNKVPAAYVKPWLKKYKHYSESHNLDDSNITFDQWFKDQLTAVLLQNLEISTTPNFVNLKARIQEVLRKNGMYLSLEGILYDSSGNEMQMSNLKLRPILIGDAVEYQNLVTQQVAGKYFLPTDISYLQAILVTLVTPPKVLGIVPLGKILLPGKLNAAKKWSIINNNDQLLSTFGQISRRSLCKTCKFNRFANNDSSEENVEEILVSSKQDPNNEKKVAVLPKINRRVLQPQRRVDSDINEGKNVHSVINKILSIFGAESLDKEIPRLYGDKVVFVPTPVDRDQYLKDPSFRQPGFRIIGGKPATSSGTPLSNKGRSGLETKV